MKRVLIALALLVLVAIGAGVAYYLRVQHESRDVHGSSTIEFVTTGAAATPPAPKEPGVAWPTYGQNAERQRFANGVQLAPPFSRAWTFRAQALVEFPPAVAYGRLFFANNNGVLFAVGAQERQASVEVRLASLRRGFAGGRPSRRLRDVHERAALQQAAESTADR